MAVYLDGINLSQPVAMQNLKVFQINAILAANKKAFRIYYYRRNRDYDLRIATWFW